MSTEGVAAFVVLDMIGTLLLSIIISILICLLATTWTAVFQTPPIRFEYKKLSELSIATCGILLVSMAIALPLSVLNVPGIVSGEV